MFEGDGRQPLPCFTLAVCLAGCSSLFVCSSCMFRLLCHFLYLCVKTPLTGLAWCSLVFKVKPLSILPSLAFINNLSFIEQLNIKKMLKRNTAGSFIREKSKTNFFPMSLLSYWHRNLLKILLSMLKGRMGAVISSSLWLFVLVSHQSASVKASTAGVLTSTP